MAEENVQGGVTDLHNGGSENGNSKTVSFFSVKPLLTVSKVDEAIQFYKSAFDASDLGHVNHLKRKADQELPLILSAELKFGSSVLIISADQSDDSAVPVKSGTGLTLCVETSDVNAAVKKAVDAGAKMEGEEAEGEKACCGDRVAKVTDPFGYVWSICNKKETEAEA